MASVSFSAFFFCAHAFLDDEQDRRADQQDGADHIEDGGAYAADGGQLGATLVQDLDLVHCGIIHFGISIVVNNDCDRVSQLVVACGRSLLG